MYVFFCGYTLMYNIIMCYFKMYYKLETRGIKLITGFTKQLFRNIIIFIYKRKNITLIVKKILQFGTFS